MRKYLFASAAVLLIATPAAAKDGSFYTGIEVGVTFPKTPSGTVFTDYITTNTNFPIDGDDLPSGIPAGPVGFTSTNPFDIKAKKGWDADIIGGYDFGMFRLEAELGYKRAKTRARTGADLLGRLNADLNRPALSTDPGAPGLPALVASDFRLDNRLRVWSAMINGLLDFGGNDGIGGYIGGGIGYGNVRVAGKSAGKLAWQAIAGIYYPVGDNIEIGLKGRYFQTGRIDGGNDLAFAGNPHLIDVPLGGGGGGGSGEDDDDDDDDDDCDDEDDDDCGGGGGGGGGGDVATIAQTTNAIFSTNSHSRFSSWSLLASLVYTFGAARLPPPPQPLPLPPPPLPPVATQTCLDGTVILATDICAPPPAPLPPPPPAPGPERG